MIANDCACIYDSADGDRPEFFTRKWRNARKPHTCYECRRTIQRGELYEHYTGKWYEGIDTYRTCAACQDIRESLCCDGWTFGQLWESVEEQIFNETGLTIACVDKCATIEGKKMLQERWMAYVEERGR